ncbi:aldehyde reductase [Xylariales sp. PMI_506]|nr:aldehyde reductase [Xylariales sp. PMI_506]
MAQQQPVNLAYGGGRIMSFLGFDSKEKVDERLDLLQELGITAIDTAPNYFDSEKLLGQSDAASRFKVLTKFSGGMMKIPATKEAVIKSGKESLEKFNTKTVDSFYLHVPDPSVPLQETLAGIDALYKEGAFKHFGLSNFLPKQVEEVIRVAKEHGYVLPTVYQGNYNAFARRIEADLFPILRRNGMSFCAYSPVAGGFFAKSPAELRSGTARGRWHPDHPMGKLGNTLYGKPSLLDALEAWGALARAEGISPIEMAHRWIAYNSELSPDLGDYIILGGSDVQLKDAVGQIKQGPLSQAAVQKIDEIWKTIAADAPRDNFNDFLIHNPM